MGNWLHRKIQDNPLAAGIPKEQKEKQPEMELTISGCFSVGTDIDCVTLVYIICLMIDSPCSGVMARSAFLPRAPSCRTGSRSSSASRVVSS